MFAKCPERILVRVETPEIEKWSELLRFLTHCDVYSLFTPSRLIPLTAYRTEISEGN